jgi:hypothetical protein
MIELCRGVQRIYMYLISNILDFRTKCITNKMMPRLSVDWWNKHFTSKNYAQNRVKITEYLTTYNAWSYICNIYIFLYLFVRWLTPLSGAWNCLYFYNAAGYFQLKCTQALDTTQNNSRAPVSHANHCFSPNSNCFLYHRWGKLNHLCWGRNQWKG